MSHKDPTVVRLFPPDSRTTGRHGARRAAGHARHAAGSGRQVPRPTAVRPGPGRHAASVRRTTIRRRTTHSGPDRYDRLLLWFAGWLFSIRIALVGRRPIDESQHSVR